MTALVKLCDLPQHLQFNPYILTGYRKPMTSRQCISSLCYWHNESFNIYSHSKLLWVGLVTILKSSLSLSLCLSLCLCLSLSFSLSFSYTHTQPLPLCTLCFLSINIPKFGRQINGPLLVYSLSSIT